MWGYAKCCPLRNKTYIAVVASQATEVNNITIWNGQVTPSITNNPLQYGEAAMIINAKSPTIWNDIWNKVSKHTKY